MSTKRLGLFILLSQIISPILGYDDQNRQQVPKPGHIHRVLHANDGGYRWSGGGTT